MGELPGGPLAERSLPFRKPRPGDRVPDLPCARTEDTPTRLYAELRGRWALVWIDADNVSLGEVARKHLGDSVVALRRQAVAIRRIPGPPRRTSGLARPRARALDGWLHRALENGTCDDRRDRRRGRPRDTAIDTAILTATLELFIAQGIAGMSVEQVAKRAGVGKPTDLPALVDQGTPGRRRHRGACGHRPALAIRDEIAVHPSA